MNYEIIIEDMHNLVEPLVLHHAERGTIYQRWLGGDDKTQPLVGCELNYSLEVHGGEDAMYIEYFTSDEKRFRVTKKIEGTEDIVYRGFLLPESYDEPYISQLFYVNF